MEHYTNGSCRIARRHRYAVVYDAEGIATDPVKMNHSIGRDDLHRACNNLRRLVISVYERCA